MSHAQTREDSHARVTGAKVDRHEQPGESQDECTQRGDPQLEKETRGSPESAQL